MAIECPQCGLFNPDTAQLCDCGYSFATKMATPPELTERARAVHETPGLRGVVGVVCAGSTVGLVLAFVSSARDGYTPAIGEFAGLMGALLVGSLILLLLRRKNNLTVGGVSVVLVAVVLGPQIASALWGIDKRPPSLLSEAAAEMNRTLPKTSAEGETELVEAIGHEGIFELSYRFLNLAVADIDKQMVQDSVVKTGCLNLMTSPAWSRLLKQGVVFRYTYRDKNGEFVGSFDLTQHDCGF